MLLPEGGGGVPNFESSFEVVVRVDISNALPFPWWEDRHANAAVKYQLRASRLGVYFLLTAVTVLQMHSAEV